MKTILSIRTKSEGTKREEFIRGSSGTVQTKIIHILNRDPQGNYEFLIDEDGSKSVKSMQDLAGEVINIVDDKYIAEFTEDDNGVDSIFVSHLLEEGALPQQHSVDQWKMVRRLSKGTDIGDKISDMNKQGANIQYIHNPIDTGIESYQDQQASNKNFIPNTNLKRMKTFRTYINGLTDYTTNPKKKSKRKKRS